MVWFADFMWNHIFSIKICRFLENPNFVAVFSDQVETIWQLIFENSNCEKNIILISIDPYLIVKLTKSISLKVFFWFLNQFNCVFLCENSVLSGCDTSSLSYIDWKKSISFFKIVSFCIELSQWSNTYIHKYCRTKL